jgi:hypothetical protein
VHCLWLCVCGCRVVLGLWVGVGRRRAARTSPHASLAAAAREIAGDGQRTLLLR